MPNLLHWSTFLTASIVLLLIPGPSVMYVVTSGLEHGYRGVLFSSLGLALGDLLQVVCTAIGISTLLASSTKVFGIFQCAGAAYLIGLGLYRLVRRRADLAPQLLTAQQTQRESPGPLILQAFFTLNPKTAVFFLALFPQFIATNAGPAWLQVLLFGCAFAVLGLTTHSLYGCLAGTIVSAVRANQRFHSAARYISGVVFMGMGIVAGINCALPRPV